MLMWARYVALGLLGCLGASLAFEQGAAQSTDKAELTEIGGRIEALRTHLERARLVADRADSIRKDSLRAANQIELDTLWVGPLRIAHRREQERLAREVFEEVLADFAPMVRGSESLLSDQIFVFRYGWRFEGMYLDGPHVRNVEMSRRYGWGRLIQKARDEVGRALLTALPDDSAHTREWMGNRPLTPPEDWSWVYRDLASTPALAARRCYRGEIAWCWEAMGLSLGGGGWEEWYAPEERRLLVEARYGYWLRDGSGRLRRAGLLAHACVNLKLDRACLVLLEDPWSQGRTPVRIPLEPETRASLLSEALSQGGEGAFTRFVSRPDASLRDRLAMTAGLDADTLMVRWRARVLDARPELHAGLLRSPISLTLWILVLVALAARSTRWRLG
jgi:hypothetical protein